MNLSVSSSRAFTLLEILVAAAAATIILAAIYGVFGGAMRLRANAMERTREMRLEARAVSIIRNDLRNGCISGGTLAGTLEGSAEGLHSAYPGYLKLTTTTGTNPPEGELFSDIQEVEYYIASDPQDRAAKSGVLVRTVDRNLLAPVREAPLETPLLAGVAALEIEFYDGQSWTDRWEVTEEDRTVPAALRVRITKAASTDSAPAAPIEIVVPWSVQPVVPET